MTQIWCQWKDDINSYKLGNLFVKKEKGKKHPEVAIKNEM